MKRLLLFLSLCCLSFSPGDYKLIDAFPLIGTSLFTTDNLGNAYVVTGNQILQFYSNGKPKANFSERSLGELRSIDVSNPLKIVLFYPDFGRLMLLNAQLAIQSSIHLREVGIQQAVVACGSDFGGYWIYDRQDFQLKKVDLNLQISHQSGDILNLTGENVQPNFMIEHDGFVYMNDPSRGIYVFDRYGTYYKTISLKVESSFQLIENELLYLSDGALKSFHLKTGINREILLPSHKQIKYARIESQELYLLTNDSLAFYSF